MVLGAFIRTYLYSSTISYAGTPQTDVCSIKRFVLFIRKYANIDGGPELGAFCLWRFNYEFCIFLGRFKKFYLWKSPLLKITTNTDQQFRLSATSSIEFFSIFRI